MASIALRFPDLRQRLTRQAVRRGLVAGAAWGVIMGAGLTALGLWECNVVCLSDAALSTAIAIVAGIITIGPVAASGARSATER